MGERIYSVQNREDGERIYSSSSRLRRIITGVGLAGMLTFSSGCMCAMHKYDLNKVLKGEATKEEKAYFAVDAATLAATVGIIVSSGGGGGGHHHEAPAGPGPMPPSP